MTMVNQRFSPTEEYKTYFLKILRILKGFISMFISADGVKSFSS